MPALCTAEFATPEDLYHEFISSKDMKRLVQYCFGSGSGTGSSKKGGSPKMMVGRRLMGRWHGTQACTPPMPTSQCFRKALARGCELWMMLKECDECDRHLSSSYGKEIVLLEKKYADRLQEPLWKTVCFLLKGTYYIENGVPLTNLKTENPESFVLHAAVGSLATCGGYCAFKPRVVVFDRALEMYPDQLDHKGPVLGQLPLHIAASNKGFFFQQILLVGGSENRVYLRHRCSSESMLIKIVNASPATAASTMDANSFYPLQLACLNGHTWTSGIEQLIMLTPHTVTANAGILLATCTSLPVTKTLTNPERHANNTTTTSPTPTTTAKNKGWNKLFFPKRSNTTSGMHQPMMGVNTPSSSDVECLFYETEVGQHHALDILHLLLRTNPNALIKEVRD